MELPLFLLEFLHAAVQVAVTLPEHGSKSGVHCYIGKLEVRVEGEVVGHLVNDDPEWVYRPVPT